MYIALHNGEKKGAFEVPVKTDALCPECGERVRVWREAEDGTARHFAHVSNMSGGDGSGGGTSCSGGESDEHQKWKNMAAERLWEVFENIADVVVESKLYAPYTDKNRREADAVVYFKNRDKQLLSGLAVEVQHKNTSKDIEATSRDYLKQDIAVAWVDESDFSDSGCRMNEADFRDRARNIPHPTYFRSNPVPWWLHIHTHVEPELERVRNKRTDYNRDDCEQTLSDRQFHVPATLPDDYFNDKAQSIWADQEWNSLFTPGVEIGNFWNFLKCQQQFQQITLTIRLKRSGKIRNGCHCFARGSRLTWTGTCLLFP